MYLTKPFVIRHLSLFFYHSLTHLSSYGHGHLEWLTTSAHKSLNTGWQKSQWWNWSQHNGDTTMMITAMKQIIEGENGNSTQIALVTRVKQMRMVTTRMSVFSMITPAAMSLKAVEVMIAMLFRISRWERTQGIIQQLAQWLLQRLLINEQFATHVDNDKGVTVTKDATAVRKAAAS